MNKFTMCPYCDKQSQLVTGKKIYPHRPDLFHLNFWLCDPCNAYVGCHRRSKRHGHSGTEPLGRLANKELRHAKSNAHAAFDPIWKSGRRSRKQAYLWLAKQMNISVNNCHIGMFNIAQCRRVVEICGKN